MRVLLVGAEREENLAVRYLAAAVQNAGHEVALAELSTESQAARVRNVVSEGAFDVVGLSATLQARAHELGRLAEALKRDGFAGHLVVGGHFPTFAYAEMMDRYPAIDSVVRHEGEITLVELCHALEVGRSLDGVRGLAFRGHDGAVVTNPTRPLIADLDGIAHPLRIGEPQRHLGVPAAFVVGSRGCHGHCTFCRIHAYVEDAGGVRYRMRSPADIATEIAALRRRRGARLIIFRDDDFFTRNADLDLLRVTALRDELWRRDVRDIALVLEARPGDLDPDVFDVLEQIGLLRVHVGIDSGSSQGLRTLGRGVDAGQNQRALDFLRERDVYACFNMLMFDPDSTARSLRESLAFIERNADVPMSFCRTEIYPGTPLHERLSREGRLIGDVFGWDYEITDPVAERAFRVFARALLDRNSRQDGLMNATLGLGHHLHLLRQFHPRQLTDALRAQIEACVRAVNTDCVAHMRAILDYAQSATSDTPAVMEDFARMMTDRVARRGRRLEEQVHDANRAILLALDGHTTKPPRAAPGGVSRPVAITEPRRPRRSCGSGHRSRAGPSRDR